MPLPFPEPRPPPLPLPMLVPTFGELGKPKLGRLVCAILILGSTSTVTGGVSLASFTAILGGFSCCGENLGGLPLLTGAGPFCPPPPPIT